MRLSHDRQSILGLSFSAVDPENYPGSGEYPQIVSSVGPQQNPTCLEFNSHSVLKSNQVSAFEFGFQADPATVSTSANL